MKRFCILLAAAGFFTTLILPVAAGPILDGITNIVATLKSDGTTNLWTEADLVDALGLLNRRYWRDMAHESGRVAWHGKIIGSSAFNVTNANREKIVRRDVYSDGYVHFTTSAPPPKAFVDVDRIEFRERAKEQKIRSAQAKIDRFNNMEPLGPDATLAEQYAYSRAATQALAAEIDLRRLTNDVETVTIYFKPQGAK